MTLSARISSQPGHDPSAHPLPPGGLWRLGSGIFVGSIAVLAPILGIAISLLPARLAVLAPEDKVLWLATLTSIGAVVAFISGLSFGALSDRTRGRWGSRNPWVLAGGLTCAAATALMGVADTLPLLTVAYIVTAVAGNMALAALAPLLPERVPVARRGAVSSAAGAAPLVGGTIGVVTGGIFAASLSLAFYALAVLGVVFTLVYLMLVPSESNTHRARPERVNPLKALRFPRHVPDFYWAFFGRLGIILGYYIVSSYQLYALTDYLGLGNIEGTALLGLSAIVNLGGSLLGVLVGGPLSDLLGRRKALTIASGVIIGVAVIMPLAIPSVTGFMIYIGIAGVGLGIFFAVDGALLSLLLPSAEDYGKDLGVLNLSTNGGQLLGPVIGSLALASGLGFPALFIAALVFCVIGAMLLYRIKSVK